MREPECLLVYLCIYFTCKSRKRFLVYLTRYFVLTLSLCLGLCQLTKNCFLGVLLNNFFTIKKVVYHNLLIYKYTYFYSKVDVKYKIYF